MMNTASKFISSLLSNDINTGFIQSGINNDEMRHLLNIGDVISSTGLQLDIPRLVVVGVQSSGKSSFLNRLIGLDLLPTGREMVTRAPLQLELRRNSNQNVAVFGQYINGSWNQIFDEISLVNQENYNPGIKIQEAIESITAKNAGNQKGITDIPIYLRIYSPICPNISLVDLPGLTVVACTDRGQPVDIKDRIRNMAYNQINDPNVIIVCVMASRADLETDLALELCKEVDPSGIRTIGVLTKPDLVQDPSFVANYLSSRNISNDLKFQHGYYSVMTGGSYDDENQYFRNNINYFNDVKSKCGVHNVSNTISQLLCKLLKNKIPEITNNLQQIEKDILNKLEELGRPIPDNLSDKMSEAHLIINKLVEEYMLRLDVYPANHHNKSSFSCQLRETFISYRKHLRDNLINNIKPEREIIKTTLDLGRGNHMDSSVCSISVVESYLLGTNSPLYQLIDPSYQLASDISNILLLALEDAMKSIMLESRFPELTDYLINKIKNELIQPGLIKNDIVCLIESETSYLWTDDKDFIRILQTTNRDQVKHVQDLIDKYVLTVIETFANSVPKICMNKLVHFSLNNMLPLLSRDSNVIELLRERDNICQERNNLEDILFKARNALNSLDKSDDMIE